MGVCRMQIRGLRSAASTRTTSGFLQVLRGFGIALGVTVAGCDVLGTAPEISPLADESDVAGTTEEATVAALSARGGAPAIWVPSQGRMVLFGGMSPITGDTHAYDIERQLWRRLAPEAKGPAPAARCHHTFVAAPQRDQGVLFGGFSFFGRFNDTWVFDARTERWTPLETTGSVPARRCLHTAAYLPSRDAMLVYGGIKGNGVVANDFFEDTHILTLADNQWMRIDDAGPGKRAGAIMFHADDEDAVYLWGGRQVATYPQGLWRFDLSRLVWEAEETTGPTPVGREDPSVFWDAERRVLWMFSGRNDDTSDVLLDDAHALDLPTRTWRRLASDALPPARWRASTVFAQASDRGILFGGWRDFGGRDSFRDTWLFDPTTMTWELRATTAHRGDFDGDEDVDLADFIAFSQCFGTAEMLGPTRCTGADFDRDGDADLADLVAFQAHFTGSL